MAFKKPDITGFSGAPTLTGLKVDGITLVVDDAGDKVGINTNNPLGTLGVDGDLYFQPTSISTSHVYTAGSLDIRANNNIKLGTDGADSVRIGRTNTSAAKVHIRSGSDTDLVVSNGKVGIGMEDPSDSLEIDGDIQLSPTAITTAHIKTTGSLDVRASGNIKIGTDGADSVRLGRVNTTAVKCHIRSGADTDLVVSNSMVGLGTETPGTQLQLEGTTPYITLKNSTAENTAGGCESKLIFEDHSDTTLGQIEASHSGSADDTKGKLVLSTHNGSALTAAITIDDTQAVTLAGDLTVNGTTTTINSTTLTVDDKVVVIASGAADSSAADGAGISVDGASATILYDHTGTQWEMNKPLEVTGAITSSGAVVAASLDISGDCDIDGTMEADAITVDGTALNEYIADTVGAMVGSNTETGITVSYDDADNTLDFVLDQVTATGAINSGSITSGFGNIDVGSSTIATTGSVTAGTVDINSGIADENASGITASFTAGEALVRGEVVYFKAADSKMWKAVATAAATSRCVAMAAEDISADAAGKFLLQGFLRDNGSFPSYTIGGTLYTPEAETSSQNVPEQTAPDSDGDFVQVIGWAVTADMVFFNPSNDVIEVA